MQETTMENRTRSNQKRKLDVTEVLDVIVAIFVFLLAWQIVYWLKFYPSFLLPSPSMMLGNLFGLIGSGTLELAFVTTGYRLIAGFLLAIVLGVSVGLLMVTFRRFGRVMSSFALGFQSFPSIAWVPFAIIMIGLSDWGILFVMVISSVFSVMLSMYSGIRNIPPIYIRAAKNMGSKRLSLFANVMLPAAMPSFITGVRQAWSFSWHALIGAEILMSTIGLGAILYLGSEFARMGEVIAAMVVIFLVGLIADKLIFSRLERNIRLKWGLTI